jgi:drug/metabolite transporter (DMT)-like permease
MFSLEQPQIQQILTAWKPILYTGILSCGVAYTFQIIGQRGMNPAVASMIMSLESVISAIAGFLILGQVMNSREITGCALMFFAIILVQLPERRKKLQSVREPLKNSVKSESAEIV